MGSAAILREPDIQDGAAIWQLVEQCKPLDLNSCYAYLLICKFFSGTSVVAEAEGKLVGFISAFRPPENEDVVFVWQVAVHSSQRGKKLAGRMLHEIIRREGCRGIRFMETTVTPSNEASRALFRSFARDLKTDLHEIEGFGLQLFTGEGVHEEERLLRIGPF